jgi:putative spermidine/putrescine transport system permease protein
MSKSWKVAAICGLLLFAVLPLLLSLGYALLYSFGVVGALNSGFTLQHWKKLLADSTTWQSFLYSGFIAFATLVLAVALSLRLALNHYQAFSRGFLSSAIYVPLAFPAMVSAFFFFQALSKGGFLSRLSYQVGLTHSITAFPDLVNDRWGIGIILAQLFLCFPFFLLLFVSRIKTERIESYLQLAESLGAGRRQAIRRIAVPVLLRKTFPNILLYFIFIFGSYEIPVLLGRSNPEMVSVLAVRKLQKFDLLHIPQGYAIAILYTAVTLILLLLILKRQKLAYDI